MHSSYAYLLYCTSLVHIAKHLKKAMLQFYHKSFSLKRICATVKILLLQSSSVQFYSFNTSKF